VKEVENTKHPVRIEQEDDAYKVKGRSLTQHLDTAENSKEQRAQQDRKKHLVQRRSVMATRTTIGESLEFNEGSGAPVA